MQCLLIVPFSPLFTQNKLAIFHFFDRYIDRIRTPPPLSRVRYQKKNTIKAEGSTALEQNVDWGDIIHDRTRFRRSGYLVWLLITQWIGSSSVDRSAIAHLSRPWSIGGVLVALSFLFVCLFVRPSVPLW